MSSTISTEMLQRMFKANDSAYKFAFNGQEDYFSRDVYIVDEYKDIERRFGSNNEDLDEYNRWFQERQVPEDVNNDGDQQEKMDEENCFVGTRDSPEQTLQGVEQTAEDMENESQEPEPKKQKSKISKPQPQVIIKERTCKEVAVKNILQKKINKERHVYKKAEKNDHLPSTTLKAKGKSLNYKKSKKSPAKDAKKRGRAEQKKALIIEERECESEDSQDDFGSELSTTVEADGESQETQESPKYTPNRRNELFHRACQLIHGYKNTGLSREDLREIFNDTQMALILVYVCIPASKKEDEYLDDEVMRDNARRLFEAFEEMLRSGAKNRRRNDEFQKKAYSKWAMKKYLEYKYSPKYPKEKALADITRDFGMAMTTPEDIDAFNRIFGGDRKKGMNNYAIKVILTNKVIVSEMLSQDYLMDVYLEMCDQTENDILVNLVSRFDSDPDALLLGLMDKAQSFKMPWSLSQNRLAINLFLKKLTFRAKKEKLKAVHKSLEGLVEAFNRLG